MSFAKASWGNHRKLILSAKWQDMVLLTSRVTLVLAKAEGRKTWWNSWPLSYGIFETGVATCWVGSPSHLT